MATTIELPQVGESVTEGIIGRWLRRPGERVEKYDPLVEVVTDKVSMEVPAPFTCVLVRTLVHEGDTVPMGAPIAEVEPEEPLAAPAPKRAEFEFLEGVQSVGPTGSGEGGQGRPDVALKGPGSRASGRGGAAAEPVTDRRDAAGLLSPVVRQLVHQYGLDPTRIAGTGLGGRVTKRDVLAFVGAQASDVVAPPAAGEEEVVLPLTPLRRAIAEHVSRSAREVPTAWTMMEVDVTGLGACRDRHRDAFERRYGAPLTYTAFVAHAVAAALGEHPVLNARWNGDSIVRYRRVHLGIAAATPAGLMVPVIHDAGAQSVAQLAVRVRALAEAARDGRLQLAEVQGGTFTLNNTGALGSVVSVPIVNHPQAAILTTEAAVKRAVVRPDDTIAVRTVMNLCLSFDHRVCDGADAAHFLGSVKRRLEAVTVSTDVGAA